jgi:hypothetical protein
MAATVVERRNRFVEFLSEISFFLYKQKHSFDVGSCFLTCRELKVLQIFISFLSSLFRYRHWWTRE